LGGCIDNNEVHLLSEIDNYLQRLDDLRDQIKTLVEMVKPGDLDWQPFPGDGEQTSNSLAALVAHCCGRERFCDQRSQNYPSGTAITPNFSSFLTKIPLTPGQF